MVPNNIPFLAHEIDRERYETVEHIRLVKIAQQPSDYSESTVRTVANWLGRRMIQWGSKLQNYGVTPLPEVSTVKSAS